VESFEAFERVFAWQKRPASENGFAYQTWLGAAVLAFFRQGGARCLVVRAGNPETYSSEPSPGRALSQQAKLDILFPGLAGGARPSRHDSSTWTGLGVVLGLDEAAFVCLPDLPELVADAATEPAGLTPPPPIPERFEECSTPVIPLQDDVFQISSAPACTAEGFKRWFEIINFSGRCLLEWNRQGQVSVQLIAAAPLPAKDAKQLPHLLAPAASEGLNGRLDERKGISSAFVQIVFPWISTAQSEALPGGIEPPDGTFAGVAARTVATCGVHQSCGRQPIRAVQGFSPLLPSRELDPNPDTDEALPLVQRLTLLGQTPTGPSVLSDVTSSLDVAHRPASIGRLTSAILRTARRIGEELVFEPSGLELWRQLESRIDSLLADFYAAGALSGETRADAYTVRCDASTTSQNDLDNGRVLVEVRFAPAYPIGFIVVVLSLKDGTVSVVEAGG
jgi:hypothetical protein